MRKEGREGRRRERNLDGHDLDEAAERLGGNDAAVEAIRGRRLLLDGREEIAHPALEHVQRLLAEHAELHAVGRVVRAVEGEQRVAHALELERLEAARVEAREGVAGPGERLEDLADAARVLLQVARVLRVDGVHLALRRRRREQWRNEELREDVERALEVVPGDVEVVVGRLGRRVGVGPTTVPGQVGAVARLVRVLGRAQEQHVLQEVRQAQVALWVRVRAHAHVQGSSSLGGVREEEERGGEVPCPSRAPR